MERMIVFKCTHCSAKLQIKVKDEMYSKKSTLRCRKCKEITSIVIPSEKEYLEKVRKKKQENAPTTFVKDDFKTEKYLKLTLTESEKATIPQSYDIDQKYMTIGRKSSNVASYKPDIGIITEDKFMSKKHTAIVRKENKEFAISDLNSVNGTWVNGEKLEPNDEIYLQDGDEIKMGRTFFKIIVVEESSSKGSNKSNPKKDDEDITYMDLTK